MKNEKSSEIPHGSHVASAVAPAGVTLTPPGDLPPAAGAPPTPSGWSARPAKKKGGTRGRRPRRAQVTNAMGVAQEIVESATYAEDFGSRAPTAANVAFVVANAAKWREIWEAARQFARYAAEQRAAWDQEALAQMEALKPAFEYVASRDASAVQSYSATAKYLTATSEIAARAASARRARAQKDAQRKTEATTHPAPPGPPPPAGER